MSSNRNFQTQCCFSTDRKHNRRFRIGYVELTLFYICICNFCNFPDLTLKRNLLLERMKII